MWNNTWYWSWALSQKYVTHICLENGKTVILWFLVHYEQQHKFVDSDQLVCVRDQEQNECQASYKMNQLYPTWLLNYVEIVLINSFALKIDEYFKIILIHF